MTTSDIINSKHLFILYENSPSMSVSYVRTVPGQFYDSPPYLFSRVILFLSS